MHPTGLSIMRVSTMPEDGFSQPFQRWTGLYFRPDLAVSLIETCGEAAFVRFVSFMVGLFLYGNPKRRQISQMRDKVSLPLAVQGITLWPWSRF